MSSTRHRLFLVASLALLGAAVAVTASVLRPDGLIRARGEHALERAVSAGSSHGLRGYASDRFGSECGVEDAHGRRRTLPDCHGYQAPNVVAIGERTFVVWERAEREVAISTLGADLALGDTLVLARPSTPAGTLLPRTGVDVDRDRLAIRYLTGQIVTVSADLSPWPGGMIEVASARLGPRGTLLSGGALGLLLLYLLGAGWALFLPSWLERKRRAGRCVEVTFPEKGSSIVLDGRAIEVETDRADFFGISRGELGGEPVTLVLDAKGAPGDAYRTLERLRPAQVFRGHLATAMAHARAVRAGAFAALAAIASVLLFALDAYLLW
jgi:hypothetical protein